MNPSALYLFSTPFSNLTFLTFPQEEKKKSMALKLTGHILPERKQGWAKSTERAIKHMAASRAKCLCSDFLQERYMPTYAFLRLDVYHYSALLPLRPNPFPPHLCLHPSTPSRAVSLHGLRLNKHITKLKYLQVPPISIRGRRLSPSVSGPSRCRTCIDAHLNKGRRRRLCIRVLHHQFFL